jgi:CRP/FNR family transcriptional regulator, cyclic AMP receptor protein
MEMRLSCETVPAARAIDVISRASWLQGSSPALVARLAKQGRMMRLESGEWAQSEGDDRHGLFIVIEGLLHSFCAAPGDREVMIGIVGPGAVLGHATRYSGGPRLVTAICVEPTSLLHLSERDLDDIAQEFPEIWRAIAKFTYDNMRSALRMAIELAALRPRARVAARLLAMAQSTARADNAPPLLNISQELLGETMGLSRKTINQHLVDFAQRGLIRLGYGRIELTDLAGLSAIANG